VRTFFGSTVIGYPRIGANRELKWALEDYWSGRTERAALERVASEVRRNSWRRLADCGIESVPSNSFSLYDHVLDAYVLVGGVPERYRALELDDLGTYFALARGVDDVAPLEMTKWFDTNYHYLVPEIGPETEFQLSGDKPLAEYREAAAIGITTRPVLLGPASLLLLSKSSESGFRPFDLLDALVQVYAELLGELAAEGAEWVQLDEPCFVQDRTSEELDALRRSYDRLGSVTGRPAIVVASYFGPLGRALPVLASAPIEGIGVDLVAGDGPDALEGVPGISGKIVVAGVIDGRNVWRADLNAALDVLKAVSGIAGGVAVSTSCSLLHVPHDVDLEPDLDPQLRNALAFADQKVQEVVSLDRALHVGSRVHTSRPSSLGPANREVRARLARLTDADTNRGSYESRAAAQQARLHLPLLPSTTIGSFPQTQEVRATRAAYRAGRIDDQAYEAAIRAEIERVIRLQEELGLDVLVHGEPERNDMVQYFAENLDGFVTTQHGWVQSYGSRGVRPPILYADVSRPQPITVPWITYAQSLTDHPVKGMLTGPVTILAWSFVRDDQPLSDTAKQVALAVRDEVADLEAAGISIIQVDEPALRELLPLRSADQSAFLQWAVEAFRLATTGVADATQIHTHMCYSEFADVITAIDGLDADVTSIEAARSHLETVADLAAAGFTRGIGPGVYDIHSPRVPDTNEIQASLRAVLDVIPAGRVWVNPDCGLKTRRYEEIKPALAALVDATHRLR
jgi:5-methyltetrahydropteroyltriglutamate--homocysteine methyltransferase